MYTPATALQPLISGAYVLAAAASVMIHEFVKETPTIFENMASAVAVQTNGLAAVL